MAGGLFGEIGPVGAAFLRVVLAALLLTPFGRAGLFSAGRRALLPALLFGLVLAAMNSLFYLAIARIPLGAAVTLEFVGPLAVAASKPRRPLDLLWPALAALGIALLWPRASSPLSPLGMALALASGGCWALYILLSARIGRHFPGLSGLTLAMWAAALLLIPAAIGHGAIFSVPVLFRGLAVALLSSALPYGLELQALRSLSPQLFGILLSLEPAIAALMGLLLLGEGLSGAQLASIALVMAASAGASLSGGKGEAAQSDRIGLGDRSGLSESESR